MKFGKTKLKQGQFDKMRKLLARDAQEQKANNASTIIHQEASTDAQQRKEEREG